MNLQDDVVAGQGCVKMFWLPLVIVDYSADYPFCNSHICTAATTNGCPFSLLICCRHSSQINLIIVPCGVVGIVDLPHWQWRDSRIACDAVWIIRATGGGAACAAGAISWSISPTTSSSSSVFSLASALQATTRTRAGIGYGTKWQRTIVMRGRYLSGGKCGRHVETISVGSIN